MSITLWKPEPDVILHQALGKLAEECAELSQAVARCLIQGYHDEEPVTHKLNRTQLMEEVADVKAAMRWLFDVLDEPFKGESERERRKFDGFKRWQLMLEADIEAAPSPETNVQSVDEPIAWYMHLWNEGDEEVKSDVRWGQPSGDDIERAEHNGHDIEHLYAKPAPENHFVGWHPMATAPIDGTIINVVGRYPDASAGFPRYAGFNNGQWLEYSRFEPQPVVCWAWRPREDWPDEGQLQPSPAPQDHVALLDPNAQGLLAAQNNVIDGLMAENDRLRKMLAGCDWYWPEDDTSSDACADGPWQIVENCDVKPGEVFGYSRGGIVETRYYGFLAPAEDADSDDEFEADEPTREAAEAKIAAELQRRAALATTEGSDNG